MDEQLPDEEPVFTPHNPTTVAGRALALSAVVCRSNLEKGAGNADAEDVRCRVIEWVQKLSLLQYFAPYELDAIQKPLGGLDASMKNRFTWEVEGLAVLAWALGRHELPKHDAQVDPYAVTDALEFLSPDALEVVASAALRDAAELKAYRELMYAIHCRVRDWIRNEQRKDFATWFEASWLDTLHIDLQQILADGDLSFRGKPVYEVEKSKLQGFEWGICEQHRASIWLVGEHPIHWETTADT